MAIRVDYTPFREVGELAVAAGKAQAAQKTQEREISLLMQAREMQQRTELAEFDANLRLETQKRAAAWESEKMALRSQAEFARQETIKQNEFEMNERERIKKMQDLAQKKKLIMEAETLTPNEKERALIKLMTGIGISTPKTTSVDPMQQYLAAAMQEMSPRKPGTTPPVTPTGGGSTMFPAYPKPAGQPDPMALRG